MKPRRNPFLRVSVAVAVSCVGHAHAADIAFSSGTPLTFTDTQSYDNGTVDRIGGGTGTVVIFDNGADYTFSGNLTLTGAWNRITLNAGASLNVAGNLGVDVSGVSLNGGTLTAGALLLGDNPNFVGSLADGKQTIEWGDSVINGSTIVANQSNASFISMGTNSGFSVNWLWINGDGAIIDSNGFDIGQTMNTWGGGGLTKNGSGTLTLTASNNFTGNTLVSDGVLEVSSTGKLYGGGYTASPVITVDSGATLRLNGWSWDAAGSIANLDYGRNRLVVNGGTIEYTGNSNFNPGDPGSAGRNFSVGTGGATLKASSPSGQTWTISSGNGNIINHDSLTLDGSGAGLIMKAIEGTGALIKTGSGTWTLSGANTYTGLTTVAAGTLSLTSPALDSTSSVVIESGATLNLDFSGNDVVSGLEIDGSGPLPAGAYNSSHPTYGSYFTGTGTLLVVNGADGTWTSLVDGDWEEPSNWASNNIASGFDKTATFNAAADATVTLNGGLTIGNLTFDVADYTLAGTGPLTLDSSGTPIVSVASGRSATISTNIAGFYGLEKTGDGTLVLTGMKSYTGGTVVAAGTLELQGANSGNAMIHGSLDIEPGATVAFTGGDGTGFGYFNSPVTSVYIDGGTLDAIGGSHLGFGSAATVNLGNGGAIQGNWQWNGDGLLSFTSFGDSTNTIGGSLNLRSDSGANHTFNVEDGTASTDLEVNANLTDQSPEFWWVSPSNLVKSGDGAMVLNGSNTYDGNTVVNAGSLQISASSSLRFRPTTNGASNSVSGTVAGSLSFLGTISLDLTAANTTNGNLWNLFNLASFSGPAPILDPAAVTTTTLGAFTEVSPGLWELPVSGAKWVFTTADGSLAYTVTATDYDSWEIATGVTGGENDDDDFDGLSNFEEYAFGLNPTSGAEVNPIAVPLEKSTGTFSYTRRTQSLTSLSYSVWYSTDLSSWTEDTGAVEGTPAVSGEVETVPVTISNALLSNTKLFIQVRAE